MPNDLEIGRVAEIHNDSITIELSRELKSMQRSSIHGTQAIGRVNSYVIVPEAGRRIVGMVTEVKQAEVTFHHEADAPHFPIPSVRLKALLVGELQPAHQISTLASTAYDRKLEYKPGISNFPLLDATVQLPTEYDLEAILSGDAPKLPTAEHPSISDPGFCIPIGNSALFKDYQVCLNPDKFFGKHAAVIGSTGSGKSCTIASIIQAILNLRNEYHEKIVLRSRFILIDTNGEYARAFGASDTPEVTDVQDSNYSAKRIYPNIYVYITADNSDDTHRLQIPYWFMNGEEYAALFKAAPGVQQPVLMMALSNSRTPPIKPDNVLGFKRWLLECIEPILDRASVSTPCTIQLVDACISLLNYLTGNQRPSSERFYNALVSKNSSLLAYDELIKALNKIYIAAMDAHGEKVIRESDRLTYNRPGYSPRVINPILEQYVKNEIGELHRGLQNTIISEEESLGESCEDSPTHFDLRYFRNTALSRAMATIEGSGRARENCSTMLLRMNRLIKDVNYSFLFVRETIDLKAIESCFAHFIRDIFGMSSQCQDTLELDPIDEKCFSFQKRVLNRKQHAFITILDLSLLPSDVLQLVTALLGRMVLEFLQRMGEYGAEYKLNDKNAYPKRAEFPTVFILDEAQNYIHPRRHENDQNISRDVFERIAREGRKFGLSLVVASQRPTELSETVLSQCSSFIVHRLQNPKDLDYIRGVVPGIYRTALDQLPALAPQHALVLGEGFRAPALVRIRDANPKPQSDNPRFYDYWVREKVNDPDVEEICRIWKGEKKPSDITVAATDVSESKSFSDPAVDEAKEQSEAERGDPRRG